jgi:hypothetical protein
VLTIKVSIKDTLYATSCGSYTWHGTTYTKSGNYSFDSLSASGCDSLTTLVLTIGSTDYSTTYDTIKMGGSFTFNGKTYDSAGTYVDTLSSASGCDSIATLVLAVDTTVPVKLLSFTGYYKAGATNLNWSTVNEVNSAYYIVQRSDNAVSFEDIKQIASLDKVSGSTYNYVDPITTDGKFYYRLKIVDKDGGFTYSNTISISINNGFSFTLYPNPVRNILTVHIDNNKTEEATLQIVSVLGKVVRQQQTSLNVGTNDVTLDVSNLAQGSYILVIKGDSLKEKQFIKL